MSDSLSIDLAVLESVRDSQLQHGLKYEDYRQYSSYCSRRLHRIRRSLNVHQGIPASAKARHQRGRKLMDISNAMVVEAGEKEQDYAVRMLIIPLCLAERAWSYAMQLKQDVGEHPRKRFHLVRRLEKAAQYASRFEKLVHDPESPCTERTKTEAIAYAAYIVGLYKLEREKWAEAKESFLKALEIYFTLVLSIKKDQVIEQYRQRIDELRASLRYCTFNLGATEKSPQVKLAPVYQFHDLAFRHAKLLQEQETEAMLAKASISEQQAEIKTKTAVVDKTKGAAPSAETSPTKRQRTVSGVAAGEEEDEEDEFEETREAIDEDESDDSDQDDNKNQQRGAGGVTGLVKGWLGGAWS